MFLRLLHQVTMWPKILRLRTVVFYAAVVIFVLHLPDPNKETEQTKSEEIKEIQEVLACKNPNLDPFDPVIMKFYKEEPPINCAKHETWVTVSPDGSFVSVSESAEAVHGTITCHFHDIIRVSDFKNDRGAAVQTRRYDFNNSDFVEARCVAKDKKEWKNVIGGVRTNIDLPKVDPKSVPNRDKPNVVMVGFDSISRNQYMRNLPKTYKRMSELGAILLNSYNIVGDGTPAALTPILTGKTESELPEVRKTEQNGTFVGDAYPFIWKDYKKAGYVTVWGEESPQMGTYQYRLRGFNSTPTDHYMRPLYLEHKDIDCFMGTPQHQVGFQYFLNIMRRYKDRPLFLFGFLGHLSHGSINNVQKADKDMETFVSDMKKENLLDNTIFIFMADHGPRFSSALRNTLQGKLEERMPMFSFLFPPWFSASYPEAYASFQKNKDRLNTPFDIYDTLMAILNKQFTPANVDHKAARSQSLFSPIPAGRDCPSASIAPHWCACQTWDPISTSNPMAKGAADAVIKAINDFTEPYAEYCQRFSLAKIDRALVAITNKEVRQFDRSIETRDGQKVLGWHTNGKDVQASPDFVQVSILAEPGSAKFEASVKFDNATLSYTVKIGDQKSVINSEISRTNKYGSQPACIEKINLNLRKYCICK